MNLETTLELFYGNTSKITTFYWYLDCDTIISCIKTNKYFYKKKKLLYNIIISYLGMFPACLRKNLFIPQKQIYYNNEYYNIEEIIISMFAKIKSNNYLKENTYLNKRFKFMIRNTSLDKLSDIMQIRFRHLIQLPHLTTSQ